MSKLTDLYEKAMGGQWNGIQFQTPWERVYRRLHAIESHLRNIEDRFSDIENRFNDHTQGQKHRTPKPKLPEPDEES